MAILWVMALALAVAGRGRSHETYWHSWIVANIILSAALAVYVYEWHLPRLLAAALPNGLLLAGFGLRWRAAREFSGRPAPALLVWAPVAIFAAVALPWASVSYAPAFTVTNVLLAALAGATAYEFWRDRSDGLPSRLGLAVAYGVMAASFAWRVGLGVAEAGVMPPNLPQDGALAVHLTVAVFHTVASGAFALSLAYERGNAELRHAASHDALTGLLNRGAFEMALRDALAQAAGRPFVLALFDIDHFKRINDRFGHAAGDTALRQCAVICREAVGDAGVVARIGGEEFAVILHDAGREDALAVVERIRRDVGSTPVWSGLDRFRVTISGGVCRSTDAPDDFDALMRLVDAGLYEAKHKGRNRIEKMAA